MGFQVGGDAIAVAALQDFAKQCRTETLVLPRWSRSEQEEVGVGLGRVGLARQPERSEEPFGCLLGGFGVRSEHLVGRLADGLVPRGYPHRSGSGDGVGGVDLVVGVVPGPP